MSSRVRIHPAAIGAFAAGAVALAIAGAFVFGAAGKLFVRKFPVVMFFDDDVNGLAVGAQVAYRGIRLGQVTKIHSVVGSQRIAVLASLERGPFVSRDDPSGGGNMDQLRKNLEDAIAQGLRAQLALQSLLTGQLYVNLVMRPDTPASFAKLEQRVLEIPTIPTIMAQLEAGLQRVPLAKVPKHLYDTLEGSARLLQSQDLAKALEAVGPLVADAQTLLRRVDKEAVPLLISLRATSDTARSSLVDITQRLDRVVTDLQTDASRLMTSLTDTSETARGTVKDVGGTVKDVGGDLQKTLARLTPEIHTLATKLQEASDTLRTTLEKTDTTLRGVDGTLAGDSPVGHQLTQALKEVAAAAQSLQTLAEYLERHPESLLTGKPRARPVR